MDSKGGAAAPAQAAKGGPSLPQTEWELPVAPTPTVPPPPKETPVTTTGPASGMDGAVLQQLLGAMSRSREDLPQHLRDILDEHITEDHRFAGKTMHKLVSNQTAAKRELAQIQTARRDFLAHWANYTNKLCLTWEKQLAEKAKTMSEFDASAERWTQQLQEATRELARLTGGSAQTVEDSDVELMESAEEQVDEELQREVQRRQLQARMEEKEQEITKTLQAAQQVSREQEAYLGRGDRERSPRRRIQSKDPTKDAANTKDAQSKGERGDAEAKAPPGSLPG